VFGNEQKNKSGKTMPVKDTIQSRRGSSAQWSAANPILADGEIGYDSTTKQMKVGDGVTAWNALAYATPSLATANTFAAAQTIEYGVIIADQVSGVGAWSIYKNDGVGSLILRDDVNSRIHATFSEGATNLASNTIFYGPFELRQILTCESQVIAKDAITCRYGVQIADVGGANVGVPQWLVYKLDGVGQALNFRDVVNSRQHMLLTPGSSNAVAATEIYSRLVVAESASFFGAVVLAIRTIATLPSAASSIGQRYQVSDSATVAYRTVFSNGSAWYYEGTAAAV